MKLIYTASILALGLALPTVPAQAQDTVTPPPPVAAPGQGECASGVFNAQGQCEEQSEGDGQETVRPDDPGNPEDPNNPDNPDNPDNPNNPDSPDANGGDAGTGTPN